MFSLRCHRAARWCALDRVMRCDCPALHCRLVMATRSGDVDPTIPLYLQQNCGLSAADVDKLLNKQSGFKGLCDLTDLRAITTAGTPEAKLALDVSSKSLLSRDRWLKMLPCSPVVVKPCYAPRASWYRIEQGCPVTTRLFGMLFST